VKEKTLTALRDDNRGQAIPQVEVEEVAGVVSIDTLAQLQVAAAGRRGLDVAAALASSSD
jgi:hypothetical protein